MKKLLSILLAASLVLALSAPVLASYETEPGTAAASGLAVVDGALYVADSYNRAVWRISEGKTELAAGRTDVKDLSGRPVGGYKDGTALEAVFEEPWGLAPYRDGLLITDSGNGAVRYLDLAEGRVYTAISGLDMPTGITGGEDGCVYISDTGSGKLYRLDADGKVKVYVSSGLSEPTGLAWSDGVLYVAETGAHRIVTVEGGMISPLAGAALTGDAAYDGDYLNGSADKARFSGPQGVAVGPDGSVYIADTGNGAVRLLRDGVVTTLAEPDGEDNWPVSPRALLPEGGVLYVGDVFTRSIRALEADGTGLGFEDVEPGAWYYDAVAFVCSNGLFNGTSEGRFSPDGTMTRAMLITVLARSAGVDATTGDSWYSAAVAWAQESGVSDGTALEEPVTREQLAAMLYRLSGSPETDYSLEGYSDAGEVSTWAAKAMAWAVESGIIEGAAQDLLSPGSSALRAQTAAMLQRYLEL